MNNDLIKKIKKLRFYTNSGFLSCKDALLKNNMDLEKSLDYLRKTGIASAVKKKIRKANEGLVSVFLSENRKTAVILEINCESDFVAKSEEFKFFIEELKKYIINNPNIKENFLFTENYMKDFDEKIKARRLELISKLGENIILKRFIKLKTINDFFFSYVHGRSDYGQIGVIVCIDNDKYRSLAYDIAMQIAAMSPVYIDVTNIPFSFIKKEREIYSETIKNKSNDKNINNKIINGKINKRLSEIVLLKQKFIKDQNISIKKLIFGKFKIVQFYRFELGVY